MTKRTKKTMSVSGKVFLRLILATVLCAIVYLSMMTVGVGMDAFSHVVGYQLYEKGENGQGTLIETHTYAEGEKHLTVKDIEENQNLQELRELKPNVKVPFQVVCQILMLVIFAIFPYHIMWEFGNRDDTNVRYKGQRKDIWRGLRVGLFAIIPFAFLWILLLIAKLGVLPDNYMEAYRLAHFSYMPFVNWVLPAGSLQTTEFWRLFALLPMLLYVPLVCAVSYRLGHNQFSIRERLVFAKKK